MAATLPLLFHLPSHFLCQSPASYCPKCPKRLLNRPILAASAVMRGDGERLCRDPRYRYTPSRRVVLQMYC